MPETHTGGDTRISRLESSVEAHSHALSELVAAISDLQKDIAKLTDSAQTNRENNIRRDGRDKAIDVSLGGIRDSMAALADQIKGLQAGINKALWLFFSALLLAVTGFIISGGLNIARI